MQRIINICTGFVALSMVAYHLLASQYHFQSTIGHLNTHLGFCLVLLFLSTVEKKKSRIYNICAILLSLLSLWSVGYVQILWPELQIRSDFNTTLDLIVGALLILLSLEATRRAFGIFLVLLITIVILYPFVGVHIPEPFRTLSQGVPNTISRLSIGLSSGLYGDILYVHANYIFLFVVFGGLFEAIGAAEFFILLARIATSKFRGGPGLLSLVSSGMVGSITGSVAANIAITGAFTIPYMKKAGYKPEHAAAIEAAASNGGQIMPPVMGAAAFVMAGLSGIPYVYIILMAILPALLYFISGGIYIYLRSGQLQLGKGEKSEVQVKELLLLAPLFLAPLAIIIIALGMGYSVRYAAAWAIFGIIGVSLIRKKTRPSFNKFIGGFIGGAKTGAGIGVSCAAIGMMVSTLTMSGLAVKFVSGIEAWSHGYLFIALLISWAMCVVIGFGGPTIVAYILVSMFAVPALVKMGVPFSIAHFFVMFSAIFGYITPPVAIGPLIAAKISGANYFKSAIEASKVAAAGFLLPFLLIYCPILVFQPKNVFVEILGVIAMIISLIALQGGLIGYLMVGCDLWERILLAMGAILLIIFMISNIFLLFSIGIIVLVIVVFIQLKKKERLVALN